MNSPFRTMYDSAQRIQESIREDALQLGLAMEQLAGQRQAHQMAKEIYEASEAEFIFDLTLTNDRYLSAKNAELREIVRDQAIIKARQNGELAQPWRVLNECKTGLENAQLSYDQAEARFKAIRAASDLQTAMLIAYAADSKLLHS